MPTNRALRLSLACVAVALFALPALCQQDEQTSANNERLQRMLERFPEADADKDGVLTMREARAYRRQRQPQARTRPQQNRPDPTFADVAYGPHERNVLDFWKAESPEPTPLIVFIHGGGFVAGDKSKVGGPLVKQALDAGVSFAAINYRYRTTAALQDVLRDSARAIQFIRTKAAEWNLDKPRIAAYGGSAGAGTSLWLAVHDDLADPDAEDPVLRESTRLAAAGFLNGQYSYDFLQWVDEFGVEIQQFENNLHGWYGLDSAEELTTPESERIRADLDMRTLITADDPPLYLFCGNADQEPTSRGILVHHPRHAQIIKQRCDEVGVTAALLLPKLGVELDERHPAAMMSFLLEHLGVADAE